MGIFFSLDESLPTKLFPLQCVIMDFCVVVFLYRMQEVLFFSLFLGLYNLPHLFFASSSLFCLTGVGVRLRLNRKELLGTSGISSAVTVLTGSGLFSGFSLPELKIIKKPFY